MKSASYGNDYRRLIYLPRQLVEHDIVYVEIKRCEKSELFFIAANNDMPLVVSIKNESLVTARRIAGEWQQRMEYALPKNIISHNMSMVLEIKFQPDQVSLFIDGEKFGTAGLVDLERQDISYIDGVGELSEFYAGPPHSRDTPTHFFQDIASAEKFDNNGAPIIFDIGSHDGVDTAYYLAKGFRVLAVDANPQLSQRLAVTFKREIEEKRLIVLNMGIADKTGSLTFYINRRFSVWGSFNKELGNRDCEAEEIIVKTVPMKDLFVAFGVPYYVKIDIEGFDEIACLSICNSEFRPTHISFEGGSSTIVDKLVIAGYNKFKLVDQSTISSSNLPIVSHEGASIQYRFRAGSSGPFGDDISKEYLNASQIKEAIASHFHNPNITTPGWVDIHAKLAS